MFNRTNSQYSAGSAQPSTPSVASPTFSPTSFFTLVDNNNPASPTTTTTPLSYPNSPLVPIQHQHQHHQGQSAHIMSATSSQPIVYMLVPVQQQQQQQQHQQPIFVAPQQQQQEQQHSPPQQQHSPTIGSPTTTTTSNTRMVNPCLRCHHCGAVGHKAFRCPQLKSEKRQARKERKKEKQHHTDGAVSRNDTAGDRGENMSPSSPERRGGGPDLLSSGSFRGLTAAGTTHHSAPDDLDAHEEELLRRVSSTLSGRVNVNPTGLVSLVPSNTTMIRSPNMWSAGSSQSTVMTDTNTPTSNNFSLPEFFHLSLGESLWSAATTSNSNVATTALTTPPTHGLSVASTTTTTGLTIPRQEGGNEVTTLSMVNNQQSPIPGKGKGKEPIVDAVPSSQNDKSRKVSFSAPAPLL